MKRPCSVTLAAVVWHYALYWVIGYSMPEGAAYADNILLALWYSSMALVDVGAMVILLGARDTKLMMATLYLSAAWSALLALFSLIHVEIQWIDPYAQVLIFACIIGSIIKGMIKCRDLKPPSSSLQS